MPGGPRENRGRFKLHWVATFPDLACLGLVGELEGRKGFGDSERDMRANGWIDVAHLRTFIAGDICLIHSDDSVS